MNIRSYLGLRRQPGAEQTVIPVWWWASILALAVIAAVLVSLLDFPGWVSLAVLAIVSAAGVPLRLLFAKPD